MNDYITHGITILRNKGFRITTARQQVLTILSETETALSPYDVLGYMSEKNQKTDAITVYRIFDCLEKNGLIHRILSSGKFVKCSAPHHETHTNSACHHIAVCDSCGTTREVHAHTPIHIPSIPDMIITGHRLELIGRCTSCQERL
jgi:Fe2+ or Zn2+ uptake regulation protein